MGIFGWSYPPGCSGPPSDDEGPCGVCGKSVDSCICGECPTCGTCGDPACYTEGDKNYHGLTRTAEQIAGFAEFEKAAAEMDAAAQAEYEYWKNPPAGEDVEAAAPPPRGPRAG